MAGGHGDVSGRVKWEVWWYESYCDVNSRVLCAVQWCEMFGDVGGMVMWEVLWCERYGHVRGMAKWCEQYGHVSSMVMWIVWWCEQYADVKGTVIREVQWSDTSSSPSSPWGSTLNFSVWTAVFCFSKIIGHYHVNLSRGCQVQHPV